jgi:hypothetical protein
MLKYSSVVGSCVRRSTAAAAADNFYVSHLCLR